eukprot:4031064-Amphidinium_carterae.1
MFLLDSHRLRANLPGLQHCAPARAPTSRNPMVDMRFPVLATLATNLVSNRSGHVLHHYLRLYLCRETRQRAREAKQSGSADSGALIVLKMATAEKTLGASWHIKMVSIHTLQLTQTCGTL